MKNKFSNEEIMNRKIPAEGSFYRHFKGNIYQIKNIAMQSDTGEKSVVYQSMSAPFSVWVMPMGRFLSEVDLKRFPDTTQRYCFQEIMYQNGVAYYVGEAWPEEKQQGTASPSASSAGGEEEDIETGIIKDRTETVHVSDEDLKRILMSGQAERKLGGMIPAEEIGRRGFIIFLDAENYHERKEIFMGLRPYLDDSLLHNIAVSLDVALEEGTLQESYESILHCINAYEKYEGGRLR